MLPKNNGSALITALFIMTLITIVVTSMSAKLRLNIYNAQLIINNDKLHLASQAVTFWAIDRLKDNNQSLKSINKNGKILTFPKSYKNIYPTVKTTGYVYDLQARFNLNNLTNKVYQTVFFNLIHNVLPNLDKKNIKLIVTATTNWIEGVSSVNQAEDEWLNRYIQQKPAYLPSYQMMQNVSEFRSVYSVSSNIYQALKPYITALPEITPMNINTASKNLLLSLINGVEKKDLDELLQLRAKQELTNIVALENISQYFKIPKEEISISSNYFLVIAKTSIEDMSYTNYITLKRTKNNDKTITVDILRQSFNTE